MSPTAACTCNGVRPGVNSGTWRLAPSSYADGSTLNSSTASPSTAHDQVPLTSKGCKPGAVSLLRNLVALLILGLLVVWLAPVQLSMASEQTRIKPWRSLLTGLLVFFLGWIVAVLIFVLVLALAFFFYWVSLPTLGFFTGAIGLMTLGLARVNFLALYCLFQ